MFMDIDRFPEFCERFLIIIPAGGSAKIPFKLNAIQRYYFDTQIRPYWGEKERPIHEYPGQPRWKKGTGRPIRSVILKGRQFGFSTFIEAFLFWYCLGGHNRNGLVVSSDASKSLTVFRILKRFYKYLPPEKESGLPTFMISMLTKERIEWSKPHESHPNAYKYNKKDESSWLVDLDSAVVIKSAAESDDLGRSETFQCVHASECATWPDFFGSLASLTSCVHPRPRTAMFLETTGKGMNDFYEFWCHDDSKSGDDVPTKWEKFFAPWYWHDLYEYKGKLTEKTKKFNDETEKIVFERILEDKVLKKHIDPELDEERIWRKLVWRRWKINQDLQGNVGMFCQEYPSTPEEAFQYTGSSIWGAEIIRRLEKDIRREPKRYHITAGFDRMERANRVNRKLGDFVPFYSQMQQHDFGPFAVYEPPMEKEKYAVFFDLAEGKTASVMDDGGGRNDYTCGQVIKCTKLPFEQVAVWHGNAPVNEIGYIAVAIATFYNNAILGWEVNGVGVALQTPIMEYAQYSNVYMREDIDSITRQKILKAGWKTTSRTKAKLVANGDGFIRENLVIIHDPKTIAEMTVFSRIETDRTGVVKYEAAKGHDDRVIALLGALLIIEDQNWTYQTEKVVEEQRKNSSRLDQGMVYSWEERRDGELLFLGDDD